MIQVHNKRLWVIGGWDGSVRSDVWWSEDGTLWTQATEKVHEDFSAQVGHQVVSYKERLWIIGAESGGDVWSSEDGETWERETHNLGSNERSNNRAVVHDNRLWVIGGQSNSSGIGTIENDVWWTENGTDWTLTKASPQDFPPREQHGFVSYNNRLWVIGGSDSAVYHNEVWRSEDGVDWRLAYNDVLHFR